MTDLLTEMMKNRADALPAPHVDVLGIVREGDRRARRGRASVLGAAGVAAAVVAAIAIPTVLADDPQRAEDPGFSSVFTAGQPSYAVGSVVHVDGRRFDVGRDVHAMVQTTAGVVFTDRTGTVWSSDGTQTLEVGTIADDQSHLRADGARAAWVEQDAGGPPRYTVLDQSSGETTSTLFLTGDDGPTEYDPALFAVDGTDVYFRDSRGVVRWDVETDEQTSLGRPQGLEVQDVKSGMLAQRVLDPKTGTTTVYFGRDFLEVGSAMWRTQVLSPDGRWALGEESSDSAALADTATGELISLEIPGYEFFVGHGWVDSDTFVGLGLNRPWEKTPADLLECEVTSIRLATAVGGGCTVTGSAVGSIAGGLVIPVGEPMDG